MRMRGGTKRDESRRSEGARAARVAAMLGTPLLPWQRHVLDVATEIDPDTGSYYYNRVVISTPRQCGKSALVDVDDTYSASLGMNRRIVYAAQTGKDSEDHFKEYRERILHSRLSQVIDRFRLSNGNMSCRFINGSTISPMAMTKVAGHGKQLDKMTIDEAFSLTKEQGDTILDSIVPTMNTRLKRTGVNAQLWITSTEGTAESTFFNGILDGLRAGDDHPRTCWFDFGVPFDSDPEDLNNIMAWHPAAGLLWYKPQLVDFSASFGDNRRGFARAFGNLRDTGLSERIISEDLWTSTTCEPMRPDTLDGTPCFGVAVDTDATHTSISIGHTGADGITRTQLVAVLDGTGSAPAEIRRLAERYSASVCMDTKGPGASLRDTLTDTVRFVDMSQGDYLTTGQAYVSGLENGTVRHAPDPQLDESVATCARTWSGDAWRITRRGSTGMTSPLESCVLAAWGAQHQPVEYEPYIL